MNLQPTQLTGKFTSKEEVLAAIEGDHLMQRLREVLAQAAGNEALQNYLVEFAGREIDMFKDTVAEVDDISELQYMVAVRYASLKSQWILLNIKMQYQNAAGLPVSDQNAYSASILTLIIEALEPYANPTAIVQISQVLAEPLAKAS